MNWIQQFKQRVEQEALESEQNLPPSEVSADSSSVSERFPMQESKQPGPTPSDTAKPTAEAEPVPFSCTPTVEEDEIERCIKAIQQALDTKTYPKEPFQLNACTQVQDFVTCACRAIRDYRAFVGSDLPFERNIQRPIVEKRIRRLAEVVALEELSEEQKKQIVGELNEEETKQVIASLRKASTKKKKERKKHRRRN